MTTTGVDLQSIDVVAELANAHEGDRSLAIEMIDAVSASADAAKIQMFSADDLAVKSHEQYELYHELSLSTADVSAIVEAAHENGIYLFADVLGEEGLDRLTETDIDGFKIHSSDLANHQLIEEIAQQDAPTLISAGGASVVEIKAALASFERVSEAELGLVYGFQNYPTKLEDAHLNRLRHLVDEFGESYAVGYTSHVDGGSDDAKHLPAWAVAAGAEFVEIHTTIDRSPEGTDYYSSLEPDVFEAMAANVETVQTALGDISTKMSDNELEYRGGHKKCVVATRRLSAGETISEDDVALKRPQGDPERVFNDSAEVIGKTVTELIETDDPVRTTDVRHTVAATLACRAESTRLYGKPLQMIGEKPILEHQISQLRDVSGIDEIILAISDTPSQSAFIEFANSHDLSYVVGDEVDVLGRVIDAGDAVDADILVRNTTENPFIYQDVIDTQIEHAIVENADLIICRNLPLGSSTEVISARALKQAHEFGDDRHRSELVTTFITENPDSFDIIGIESPEAVARPDVRLTVDNPCDLILTRKLWDHVSETNNPYDLERLLTVYDEHDLASINDSKPDGTTEDVVALSWHKFAEPDERIRILD